MKKLTTFFPLFVMLLSGSITAQSLYNLTWEAGNIEYNGLLVFFNESDQYMRISYFDDGNYDVLQSKCLFDADRGEDGIERIRIVVDEPKFVLKNTAADFTAFSFIWIMDPRGEKWDGPFVEHGHEKLTFPGKKIKANMILLNAVDLDPDFLRQFYYTDEEDYQALIASNSSPAYMASPENHFVTLHFIALENCLDEELVLSSHADIQNLRTEFSGIAKLLNLQYDEHIVDNEGLSKSGLLSFLRNLHPRPEDVVIFYYSGNGYHIDGQNSRYPQMDLRKSVSSETGTDNSLNIYDIHELLQTTKARMTIVLADCSNSQISSTKQQASNIFSAHVSVNAQEEKLQELFLEMHGHLIAVASSPGGLACCDNRSGGFFTNSFLKALSREVSYLKRDNPDWKDIFNTTILSVKNKTGQIAGLKAQIGLFRLSGYKLKK